MSEDYTLDRMNAFLKETLVKNDGRFCIENLQFPVSTWGVTMFKKFLKSEVQKGTMKTEKDDMGRVWYSRA